MKFTVCIADFAEYDFDSEKYTEEEAKEMALEWFSERKPNEFKILYENEHP